MLFKDFEAFQCGHQSGTVGRGIGRGAQHDRHAAAFGVQQVHIKLVLHGLPMEMADTIVVRLSDLDNYAFSRLTIKALEYYY